MSLCAFKSNNAFVDELDERLEALEQAERDWMLEEFHRVPDTQWHEEEQAWHEHNYPDFDTPDYILNIDEAWIEAEWEYKAGVPFAVRDKKVAWHYFEKDNEEI